MFNAQPYCEGFGLHGKSAFLQKGKGIPGAVPHGENQCGSGKLFPAIDLNARKLTFFCMDTGQCASETDLTAQRFDFFPEVFYDRHQKIRAQVGFLHIQDLVRCPAFHKETEDLQVSACRILDQGVQFSVRKGSRTALPELHVGFCIQSFAVPEGLYFFHAAVHIVPPFDDKGGKTCTSQIIGTEKTCRTAAHNYRALPSVSVVRVQIGVGYSFG